MGAAEHREFLHQHGTKVFRMKPGALIEAASADLRLRARKTSSRAQVAPLADAQDQYAFHRAHVRAAVNVPDLLQIALDRREEGRMSAKFNTRLVYENEDLLREALRRVTPCRRRRRAA